MSSFWCSAVLNPHACAKGSGCARFSEGRIQREGAHAPPMYVYIRIHTYVNTKIYIYIRIIIAPHWQITVGSAL